MRNLWLLSLILMCNSSAFATSIYKWVDSQGNTHFASQPPAKAHVETVNPRIAPATPHTQPQAGAAPAEDPQQAIDDKVKTKVAEQEKVRQEYCQAQRTNLAQLNNNPRVMVEEAGQMKRLSEEERQAKIQEIETNIAKEC